MIRSADDDHPVAAHGIVGRAEQLERLQTTVVQRFVAALGAGLADRRAQVVHGQCVGTLRELIASRGEASALAHRDGLVGSSRRRGP